MKNLSYLWPILAYSLLIAGCQENTEPSEYNSQEVVAPHRQVIQLKEGVYIGVDSASLKELHAYRLAAKPSASSYHLGRAASPQEIKAWDIDIPPDGKGLPPGSGTIEEGTELYLAKCASCHGLKGEGIAPYNSPLVMKESDSKTIGSYWPYATTLFDYIRRAMPFNLPGSLSNEEVYSLTAFLLHANEIIPENTVIDAENLPNIVMPNVKNFIPDDRERSNSIH